MNRTDIVKIHNDGHTQFTYFMAGAAGASIGYSLSKLDGQPPSYWLLPGAVALLLWMISFFSGCMMITWGLRALKTDWMLADLNDQLAKANPMFVTNEVRALREKITKDGSHKQKIAGLFKTAQVWTLYAGVIAFVVWRAIEMFRPHVDTRPWCFVPGFSA